MRAPRAAIIACLTLLGAVTLGRAGNARSGDTAASGAAASTAPCQEAIVNPVSGYAECVLPRGAPVDPPPPRPPAVTLAVFDFELDDVRPAALLLGEVNDHRATLEKVSSEARRVLGRSGRYIIVDPNVTGAVPDDAASLRDCNGCEAGMALQLGAEQALVGVVRLVTQTDYYVLVQIRDARTGKVLDQQGANFAGGPEDWASGVRMLLEHQVLAAADTP